MYIDNTYCEHLYSIASVVYISNLHVKSASTHLTSGRRIPCDHREGHGENTDQSLKPRGTDPAMDMFKLYASAAAQRDKRWDPTTNARDTDDTKVPPECHADDGAITGTL